VTDFAPISTEYHDYGGGHQRLYQFANGYGASVVTGPYTYGGDKGLFELAVLNSDGEIECGTPVIDDVTGWLTEDDVQQLLARISELPGGAS